MEIVEAILKYFTDNSATLINIMLPILITFFITWFFRNKDKKDNDARNLRAELREYFLTNCKPIIDEIVDDQNHNHKVRKYVYLKDEDNNPLSVIELQKHFKDQYSSILNIPHKFTSLRRFVSEISHKEYIKRFDNYYYLVQHISMLYHKLIFLQIMNSKALYESVTLDKKQKEALLFKIMHLITQIDFILSESELILFNYNFDNDEIIFQRYIDILNTCVLNTGLDPNKECIYNREEFEKELLKMKKEFDN